MSPEVSIVMPVRNAAGTLADAVASCLQQTFRNHELILVLNGCTDHSADCARMAASREERIVILDSPENLGVTGAAAVGLEHAAAPLIARMDADDVCAPERLDRQVSLLRSDPSLAAVSCGVRLIDSKGEGMQRYVDWVNGLGTPEAVSRERFIECPVIQPSLMFRSEALRQAGGYRQVDWAEDHDLFLRMLEKGMRFGKVDEVLLDWRDSTTRLTRTDPAYEEEQVWRMKAHFLARVPRIRNHGVAISGAGPIGKRLAKLLREAGTTVHGFFEVHPRRIGEQIGGLPVAGLEEFGTRWREAVLLSAVGIEGGRDRVREVANPAGYLEGEDFWCCC